MSDELKINLAYAYYKLGNNQQALDLLNDTSIKDYKHESQKAKLIRYLVYRSMGDVSQALDVFELYSIKNDSINEELFKHKVQTSEERHALQLAAEKKIQGQKNIVVLSIAFAMLMTVVVLILIILYRSQRNKKLMAEEKLKVKKAIEENLNMRVAQLEDEAEKLRTLLSSKTDPLPADVREALRQRIEMLNALLASEISDNDKYEAVYDEWIRNLTADNQAFMESNKLAFKASHPEFIKYSEDHGLTDKEINYVCLYALGLRGKEVGNYMQMRSHVNISTEIRRKLGIDQHETNIGIYVRKVLSEYRSANQDEQ